jgi:hypothetical protein
LPAPGPSRKPPLLLLLQEQTENWTEEKRLGGRS